MNITWHRKTILNHNFHENINKYKENISIMKVNTRN